MGWELKGELVVVQDSFGTQLVNDLYIRGAQLIPKVFLNDPKPYGERVDVSIIKIPKDRYYAVGANLRNAIKTDLVYKAHLHKLTWKLLREFVNNTLELEKVVQQETHRLTPEFMSTSLDQHSLLLALTEFNGILPVDWYKSNISELSQNNDSIEFGMFTFSECIPHRMLIRLAKLRLLRLYLRKGKLEDADLDWFIRNYGYVDPNPPTPLLEFSLENKDTVNQEILTMSESMTVDDVNNELSLLYLTRKKARKTYLDGLQKTSEQMHKKQKSHLEILNFVSALSVISLAVTEEEYRHIWQNRYWSALGKILRRLGLPATTSEVSLLQALKTRPF